MNQWTLLTSLRATYFFEGDEDYALSVAVPLGAEGLKVYSRRSYAEGATSVSTTRWPPDSTRPTR